MASATYQEFTVDESVSDFLRREGAHDELAKICNLARSAFPALICIEFTLQEDPDEVARGRVVACVRLPESLPEEQLLAGVRYYHQHNRVI
jgi:hypothetical protein